MRALCTIHQELLDFSILLLPPLWASNCQSPWRITARREAETLQLHDLIARRRCCASPAQSWDIPIVSFPSHYFSIILAMGYGLVCLVVSLLLALVRAQSTSTQTAFQPAAVPLALRSPYLSAWQNTTNGANVAVEWPQFWNDAEVCSFYAGRDFRSMLASPLRSLDGLV